MGPFGLMTFDVFFDLHLPAKMALFISILLISTNRARYLDYYYKTKCAVSMRNIWTCPKKCQLLKI